MGNPNVRWTAVAIDCAQGQAPAMATYYGKLLGFDRVREVGPNWAQIDDPDGPMHLNIQGEAWYEPPVWPEEEGALKKMMHFEIEVDDVAAAVALAIEAGGRENPWQPPTRNPARIRIVLDPAGHPMCLFARGE